MSYVPPKPRWDKHHSRGDDRHRDCHGSSSTHVRHSSSRERARDSDVHHHHQQQQPSLTTTDMSRERLLRILSDYDLNPEIMGTLWLSDSWPDIKKHLFVPETGLPRFVLSSEVWRPVIRAYFAWYNISREQCTLIWADIVDMLLRLPDGGSGDAEFRAWAYGCLCKFFLEDRQRLKNHKPAVSDGALQQQPHGQYDPSENWKL